MTMGIEQTRLTYDEKSAAFERMWGDGFNPLDLAKIRADYAIRNLEALAKMEPYPVWLENRRADGR